MPDPERELTPQQDAAVRRLLAEVRATDPVPDDVAARLDRVLADLGETPGGADAAVAAGDPLAHPLAHPLAGPGTDPRTDAGTAAEGGPAARRRRVSWLLAAACVVGVVGVGLGQLDALEVDGGADGGAGGAESTTGLSADRAAPEAADGGSARGQADGGAEVAGSGAPDPDTPVGRVRESRFSQDAAVLRRGLPRDAGSGRFVALSPARVPSGFLVTGRPFDCPGAPWGAGVLVPVVVGGTPGVLAYRPVTGDSQVVELLRCGTGETLRSTTLPAG